MDLKVEGTWDDAFKSVVDTFRDNFSLRGDKGAGFAVVQDGQVVVDIWGGEAAPGRPWASDTLVNVWSTTKAVVAVAAQVLVDRSQLDVDAPVARYWPEFAKAGKDALPVRFLLSHRAGLCGFREPVGLEDLADWERVVGLLAGMEPWWEPGTLSGYHALTYGYLVGEVVHRITGQTIGQFVANEIARPLGADFYIGLDTPGIARSAVMSMDDPGDQSDVAAMFASLDPAAIAALTNPSMAAPDAADIANQEGWKRAEIPAANGHATALGLAAIFSELVLGRLLSADGIDRLREGQGRGVDLVLAPGMAGAEMEFALGVVVSGPERRYGPNPRAFGHDGYGGSFVLADPEKGIAMAYVMNHMGLVLAGDPRKTALVDAVYAAL